MKKKQQFFNNFKISKYTFLSLYFLVHVFYTSFLLAFDEIRTWKNSDGKEIQAYLVDILSEEVKLKRENSEKIYTYKINMLSKDDKNFIANIKDKFLKQKDKKRFEAKKSEVQKMLEGRSEKWSENYEESLAEAKKLNLPILINFTGSDWCGWCIRLKKSVFKKGEFKKFANKNLVLMKADFPNRVKQSSEVKRQNKKLASKYKISGYPTVYLLSPDKKILGKLGYMPKANDFIKKIEKYLGCVD